MNSNRTVAVLSLASLLTLVACGGDGGSSPPPPPPPPPAPLAISGTAATGAAIAGGTVEAKCASGSGSATTLADGSYGLSIAGGALPCVLRVTSGGTVLHSIVASGGTAAVANITPLTELLAANVAGGAPAALFAGFDAAAQARVTSAAIAEAIAAARSALKGTIDLTGVDPIGGALVAANAGTAGNALDGLLDQLARALAASQATLADLSAAVAAGTSSSPPALRQIAPHAASCAALRSGDYVAINPHETANDPGHAAYHLRLDATALTFTDIEPGHPADSAALTPVDGQPCRFTYDGEFGTETALVSPGGVIVVRGVASNGLTRTSLLVPAQTIPLADLAGAWDSLAYTRAAGGPLMPYNGVHTLDAQGGITAAGTFCAGLVCEADTAEANLFTVNPRGGFDVVDDVPERAFAYVTDSGAMSMYLLRADEGGLIVMTKQVALALPAVGSASTFWDFTIGNAAFSWTPANGASDLVSSTITVTATDPAAHTFTRLRSADQRVDTLAINSPADGMRQRSAGANLSGTIMLPMTDLGLVFYTSVASSQNFFGISIDQP